MRVAGVMSGTSLDGIDVAIVDITRSGVDTVACRSTPYPRATKERILAVSDARCTTEAISRLNFELGELYAKAVLDLCRRAGTKVELIGCHGQTIFHEGGRNTFQTGEAAVIAERIGVPVVSDFRVRDIAAGGQGAPLVPFADYFLFGRLRQNAVALNIGGIANITILPRNGKPEDLIAFDTGPGNMVIDHLAAHFTNGTQQFDRGGRLAARGHVNRALLDNLLRARYYSARPPKTAGREQYGRDFIAHLLSTGLPAEDLVATATALTASTIALAINSFAPRTQIVVASGGGVHNRQLMGQFAALLPDPLLTTTAEFGIDPDAKEAIAFALLAYRTWQRRPSNVPSATGARHPVILGKVSY
jgi:anhydro-N-acetylmuramic acid kinase